MLNQRRRRWADAIEMLYKCFVFNLFQSVSLGNQIPVMGSEMCIWSSRCANIWSQREQI